MESRRVFFVAQVGLTSWIILMRMHPRVGFLQDFDSRSYVELRGPQPAENWKDGAHQWWACTLHSGFRTTVIKVKVHNWQVISETKPWHCRRSLNATRTFASGFKWQWFQQDATATTASATKAKSASSITKISCEGREGWRIKGCWKGWRVKGRCEARSLDYWLQDVPARESRAAASQPQPSPAACAAARVRGRGPPLDWNDLLVFKCGYTRTMLLLLWNLRSGCRT